MRLLIERQADGVQNDDKKDECIKNWVLYYVEAQPHYLVFVVFVLGMFQGMNFRSKKLLYKGIFCFEQFSGTALDLNTILFDKEVCKGRWQLYGYSYLPQLFIVLGILLGLIKLLILHEHDRNCKVEQEE